MYHGFGFGAPKEVTGEVVFNTGMTGYTESLTDPSYSGQILVQTYPLIGNYGVPSEDRRDDYGFPFSMESERPQVEGYVVSTLSESPSHWAGDRPLEKWLKAEGVPGIGGLDTRMLAKKLRTKGVMLGVLKVAKEIQEDKLATKIGEIPDPSKTDLVKGVSIDSPITHPRGSTKIVVIDCGVKLGIIRNLLERGATVIRVPYDYTAESILALEPSGILVSNGPGEPKMCVDTIKTVGELLETDLPMMGICLGNQLQALASGGETYKLKFGHRGQNHSCKDLRSGRHYITSQNHGFTVDPSSLEGTGFEVSFVNTNDGTVEGIRHRNKPFFGVQFHPEASPGPLDTIFLFDEFMREVSKCPT
jgi:carbamoyl-phosphate synthase small subunit